MHLILVTIVMADGSRGRHMGFYRSSCDAIVRALECFPDARCVSGRPA